MHSADPTRSKMKHNVVRKTSQQIETSQNFNGGAHNIPKYGRVHQLPYAWFARPSNPCPRGTTASESKISGKGIITCLRCHLVRGKVHQLILLTIASCNNSDQNDFIKQEATLERQSTMCLS